MYSNLHNHGRVHFAVVVPQNVVVFSKVRLLEKSRLLAFIRRRDIRCWRFYNGSRVLDVTRRPTLKIASGTKRPLAGPLLSFCGQGSTTRVAGPRLLRHFI